MVRRESIVPHAGQHKESPPGGEVSDALAMGRQRTHATPTARVIARNLVERPVAVQHRPLGDCLPEVPRPAGGKRGVVVVVQFRQAELVGPLGNPRRSVVGTKLLGRGDFGAQRGFGNRVGRVLEDHGSPNPVVGIGTYCSIRPRGTGGKFELQVTPCHGPYQAVGNIIGYCNRREIGEGVGCLCRVRVRVRQKEVGRQIRGGRCGPEPDPLGSQIVEQGISIAACRHRNRVMRRPVAIPGGRFDTYVHCGGTGVG